MVMIYLYPILFVIFLITFIVFCTIKSIKYSNLQKEKERKSQERLNSVVPGTILRKENKSGNPFIDKDLPSIKILETAQNSSGEIWVKYAYESIIYPGEYNERQPYYDTLKTKLKLYTNIELQKNQ